MAVITHRSGRYYLSVKEVVMERILLVINARKPDVFTIDFACSIASLTHTALTGLFIENLYFEYIPVAEAKEGPYFKVTKGTSAAPVTVDTDQAIRLFKAECQARNIKPEVYIDQGEPIQEAVYESRFADLLIIDPDINFYNREEPLPSHFVREILSKSECPVLLAPESFDGIEEIAFCYDGSTSSIFAVKQMTYLFPEMQDKKITLLEVGKSSEEHFTDSHKRMMDWLRSHYKSVCYHALKGEVKDELFNYFFMKKKMAIVMGAYGRSLLSNLFRKSSADLLIRMVDLPIFITHH